MFGKKQVEINPNIQKRDELVMEVHRWSNEIDYQIDIVMAQYQMTFLFPLGCPDDCATHSKLEKEQKHLRNLVAEYDLAMYHLRQFAKEHPDIRCPEFEESHEAIRTMLRWKNKKR